MFHAVVPIAVCLFQPTSQAPAPQSAAPPTTYRLRIADAQGKTTEATAWPLEGGGLVTAFKSIENAAKVDVVAGERSVASLGIVAWSANAGFALITAEWAGQIPAAVTMVPATSATGTAPAKEADLKIVSPAGALPVSFSARAYQTFLVMCDTTPDQSWDGAPVIEGERIVGLYAGIKHIMTLQDPPRTRASLDVLYPEFLISLTPGPAVPWDAWKEQRQKTLEAWKLVARAEKLTGDDRQAQTAALCRKAVELDPFLQRAWSMLGRSLCVEDDEAAAVAAERAIALWPTDYYAYTIKASSLSRLERKEEAVTAGRQAVERAPKEPSAHAALGFALQKSGQFEEALAQYKRVLEFDPSDEFAKSGVERLTLYLQQVKELKERESQQQGSP